MSSFLFSLFACGVPSETGETACEPDATTPVVVDDVGGQACVVGTEPTSGTLVADTTVDGAAWIHVLASGCSPNACQIGADPQCTATLEGDRVLVDVQYDYTVNTCMSCTTACGQLWLTCEVPGGLSAGDWQIVYEDEPAAAISVPYTGAPVCSGAAP